MRKPIAILLLALLGAAELAAQSIQVTSPGLNDSWCRGRDHVITWTSTGAVGAKVSIRLRQGNVRTDVAVTENDGSYTWGVPASLAPGTYAITIRNIPDTVFASSAAFTIADCGAPPPVMKKIPPYERLAPIVFPPQPRITQFFMDKQSTRFGLWAENTGGAMKQDAQVVLSIPGGAGDRKISQTWPKGKQRFTWDGRVFANDDDPHLADCTQMGGGDLCLGAEIHSPEVVGFPYPGLHDQRCFPCYPDLAVVGLQWSTSGALSFSVGNNGYCPSFPWTYRLYKDGQLVETSVRYGSKAPGAWGTITANYHAPAASSAGSTFRVELVPESPAWEKNKENNTLEVTTAPSSGQYQIAISDIQFFGVVCNWNPVPIIGDEYYRLVFTLKNTSVKAMPLCYARCRIFIDSGQVGEVTFPISFDPYEERLIVHDYGFPKLPILPYGIHMVKVWVSLCPSPLTKKMIRPPEG